MASARPRGFLDILTSIWTLLPLVGGVSALIVGYMLEHDLELYYVVAGLCGAVAFASLLTQWLLSGAPAVSHDVKQAREELTANLESLGRGLQRRLASEASSAGSMAPVEK